jgi:hypothetical protein
VKGLTWQQNINITYCTTADLGQLSRYSYSAVGWTTEESWLQSQQEQNFLHSEVYSLVLTSETFYSVKISAFHPTIKKPGRKANQSSPSCAEISYNAIQG